MTDKYSARAQQILDRYLQSSFGLWNALLTINGIILAASSLLPSKEISIFKLSILGLALLSIGLLIHNYVLVKSTYYKIGQILSDHPDTLTEEKQEKDMQQALSRNKRVQWCENICLGILCLQAVLVVLSALYTNA